jgi:hypothetical protein
MNGDVIYKAFLFAGVFVFLIQFTEIGRYYTTPREKLTANFRLLS